MKKHNSLLGAALAVSLLVLLGKLLGFGREALIAAYFGASAETDAFFFAQGMPSMIFPAVGSSLAFAFTSLYVKRMSEEGEQRGDHFASRVLLTVTLLGLALGMLGVLFAPVIVPLFAPGFKGSQLELAVRLTRLTMGAFVLTLLQYILGAILNSRKLFTVTQIAGLLYNIAIIAVTALLGRGQSMEVLTLIVVFGMVFQVAGLVVGCQRHFCGTLRDISPIHPEIAQLLRLALPILLGNSVVQLNNIVDKALGSTLDSGSLSALSYANSLNIMVIDVFVISLSTVLFPTLTADAARGDMERYEIILRQSLSGMTMLLVPISCITFLDAAEIVKVVFARGSFDQTAVSLTALVLACYAPRFVFAGIREVLSRAFFAIQDTRTPMIAGGVGVGCNVLFSVVFVRWLGLAGIALGTVVSVFVIAVLLLRSVHLKMPVLHLSSFFRSLGKQLLAGAVLVAVLLVFKKTVSISSPLFQFIADSVVGFGIYLMALLPLSFAELHGILGQFRKK